METYEVEVRVDIRNADEDVDPELFAHAMDLIDDRFKGSLPDVVASALSSTVCSIMMAIGTATRAFCERKGIKRVDIKKVKPVEWKDGVAKLVVEIIPKN